MDSHVKQPGKPTGPGFPVVGFGASAGGIQALLQLFETAPATPGVAFVVVLHLSPDHTSHAHEVIQRVTDLVVRQVSTQCHLRRTPFMSSRRASCYRWSTATCA
nr:chemotaxis protein CheB [Caballeronia zhejiangensis]